MEKNRGYLVSFCYFKIISGVLQISFKENFNHSTEFGRYFNSNATFYFTLLQIH